MIYVTSDVVLALAHVIVTLSCMRKILLKPFQLNGLNARNLFCLNASFSNYLKLTRFVYVLESPLKVKGCLVIFVPLIKNLVEPSVGKQ